MTQIMNLPNLAPEIQEELLFLSRVQNGTDEVCLRDLLPVAGVVKCSGKSASDVASQANHKLE